VIVPTTPRVSNNTTAYSTTTTPSGQRNKREAAIRRRHRRNQATSTTPTPKKTPAPDTPPHVTGLIQDDKKELCTISVEPALEAGHTYVMDIEFTGLLHGSLYGFYRSSYKDKNGTRMYVFAESLLFDSVLHFVD
jgi:hypothetical protein